MPCWPQVGEVLKRTEHHRTHFSTITPVRLEPRGVKFTTFHQPFGCQGSRNRTMMRIPICRAMRD